MKYFITRSRNTTGRIEYRTTKIDKHRCCDWCDREYIEEYPYNVWKFSKQGAKNFVERENKKVINKGLYGYKYNFIPVTDILPNYKE